MSIVSHKTENVNVINFQVLDSGVFAPVKKEEPEVVNVPTFAELERQRRAEIGFPKVIKVTIGETACRVFIEGDDVYAESDDGSVSVEFIHFWELPYEHDWRRIEYEVFC